MIVDYDAATGREIKKDMTHCKKERSFPDAGSEGQNGLLLVDTWV
jgi:hypothetical protein